PEWEHRDDEPLLRAEEPGHRSRHASFGETDLLCKIRMIVASSSCSPGAAPAPPSSGLPSPGLPTPGTPPPPRAPARAAPGRRRAAAAQSVTAPADALRTVPVIMR